MDMTSNTLKDAHRLVAFWRSAGPAQWFKADPAFDKQFGDAFAFEFVAAVSGQLDSWRDTPIGALALVILLDQYPRNSFRGTMWMYVTDQAARIVADMAISKGFDKAFDDMMPLFFYLPFGHSEVLADQERAAALCLNLGEPSITHSQRHLNIVRSFGRFPHRNGILERKTRPEEQFYLDNGGFQG